MGSFRAGIAFASCPKCYYEHCIVEAWDRDYEGIVETYYCLNCNKDRANLFLRQYLQDKIWRQISRLSNSIVQNEEEKVAYKIMDILNFDDNGNFPNSELLRKLSGIREFNLKEIFNFKLVKKKVYEDLKKEFEE